MPREAWFPEVLFCPHRTSTDDRGTVYEMANKAEGRTAFVRNTNARTLRGLHYGDPLTDKFVICLTGAMFDVLVDVRPGSPTRHHWMGRDLHAGHSLWIPAGFAHGYLTLAADTIIGYVLRGAKPDANGLCWDDPQLGIEWPAAPARISGRDCLWPLLPGSTPPGAVGLVDQFGEIAEESARWRETYAAYTAPMAAITADDLKIRVK